MEYLITKLILNAQNIHIGIFDYQADNSHEKVYLNKNHLGDINSPKIALSNKDFQMLLLIFFAN
jgi:hypothetical protein